MRDRRLVPFVHIPKLPLLRLTQETRLGPGSLTGLRRDDVRGELEIDAIVGDLLAAAIRTVHQATMGCWIRSTSR